MPQTPQWIGIAISVAVMLGGTAVNLFIIGRFVGQMGEAMKNIAQTLAKVEERLEEVEQRGDANQHKLGLQEARLVNAEAAADKFWEYRDAFTAMKTTVELEGKWQRERADFVNRSVAVIERQFANLMTSKAGFTTLTSGDRNE